MSTADRLSEREQGFVQLHFSDFDGKLPFKLIRMTPKREWLCDLDLDYDQFRLDVEVYLGIPLCQRPWWTVWTKVHEYDLSLGSHEYTGSLVAFLKAEDGDLLKEIGVYLLTKVFNESAICPSNIVACGLSKTQILKAILISEKWQDLDPTILREELGLKGDESFPLEKLREQFLKKFDQKTA